MSEQAEQIGSLLASRLEAFFTDLDEIRRKADEKAKHLTEPFIGKKEAAEFLNMAVSTLENRMAEDSGPPRYIDGGKINFLRSELRVWRRQWRAGDQTGLETLDT